MIEAFMEHWIETILTVRTDDKVDCGFYDRAMCNVSGRYCTRDTQACQFLSPLFKSSTNFAKHCTRIIIFIESVLQMCFEGKWLQNRSRADKMNRDHFWRSISRNNNVEVSALSPLDLVYITKQQIKQR